MATRERDAWPSAKCADVGHAHSTHVLRSIVAQEKQKNFLALNRRNPLKSLVSGNREKDNGRHSPLFHDVSRLPGGVLEPVFEGKGLAARSGRLRQVRLSARLDQAALQQPSEGREIGIRAADEDADPL